MSIPAERLREGQQILVRGKVAFSRLTALITGDELVKSIERARKRGSLYPTEQPHTTISLVDPVILFADANAPTQEEQFVSERIYVGKSGANAGRGAFSIDSTSPYLPTVLEQDPGNPGSYRQLVLERDLDTDMDVTIVLQVFKPKTREKRGLGLQQVILNEPVRYYSGGGADTSALAARGIVVNGPIAAVPATAPTTGSVATQDPYGDAGQDPYGVPANTQMSPEGLAAPMPGAQGTPFAPAQPQAPAAAVAPQAPAGETPAQTIARLQQQLAESQQATAASGGASAFDGGSQSTPDPWAVTASAPAFQG